MSRKTLTEWLEWQEKLTSDEIRLGLERVAEVALRLDLKPPEERVFTVAGTNGKGSCAAAIEALLRANEIHTGLYTSPHLVSYNERICIDGQPVSDDMLVEAFEHVEKARRDVPLTYFEFGTLAALWLFTQAQCEAWVLEVGLGGRLDAVNVIDPDIAVITTISLDHQEWLGDSVEKIAREKAGIMRGGKPALFGDDEVPEAIRSRAAETGAELHCLGEAYTMQIGPDSWSWQGKDLSIDGLSHPHGATDVQILNQGLALATCEMCEPRLLADADLVRSVLASLAIPGRLQVYHERHEWLLDVAHNPQAAAALARKLRKLDRVETWVVIGMMADKALEEFAAELGDRISGWITCDVDAPRGQSAAATAAALRKIISQPVEAAESVEAALECATERCPEGGRVIVCGSFHVVGPALKLLGLY
jgi:dihydrofolate synthase/folylpolyglutamate synthase